MPLNKAFEGKTFPQTAPVVVTQASIEEFADAIGDSNPTFHGPSAVAPPTYLTKLNFIYGPQMLGDPDLGLNYAMVVHGSQEYEYTRPLRAGDTVIAKPRIAQIFAKGRNEFMITEATIETESGEQIALARSTIVSRGTAEVE
ncbi:MAG: MaoC family dehydratase N-terminal domain-containing protein [Actinobacteria bacterium]|nr:MaoC family dehydratase N-terminal domain-containing protein [Actinomycetota bacterium]